MNLSFLVQLILLLLLVVSLYMVFTDSVSGRMKIIMIVFCLVVGIYLVQKINVLKNHNDFISSPESARRTDDIALLSIKDTELKKSQGHYAISVWMFIDDWNYRFGQEKVILQKKTDNLTLPKISLDPYKNDLRIHTNVLNDDQTSYQTELKTLITTANSSFDDDGIAEFSCSGDYIYNKTSSVYVSSDSAGSAVDTTSWTNAINCANIGISQEVVIENIPLQKWVNVIFNMNNRALEVYMNGKLYQTKAFDNLIDPIILNTGTIEIAPSGGFGGYISKVQYYPYYITSEKAWSIYKGGFGDAFESTLDRFNMSLSFYKDSVEQNKMYLF